ncbi:hypothetical protein KJ991_00075 [Patescibacteria group bacterium]|nr:hypothetical protein [Patescibacteria group bacterium]MBU4057667.1 hypothetical protein [Patescibacteria group bacterium]MBU4115535.1 hypothetical protein [Patescibacteria group bacterium]
MLLRKKSRFSSSKVKETRRKKFLVKIFLVFFVLLVIFILSIFVSRISDINITNIIIKNEGSVVTEKEILTIINNNINGKYLGLYPKTNIFIYGKKKIEADIYNKFKRIKNIDIKRVGFNGISITIKERSPAGLWCGKKINIDEKCYFLDEDGYIYTEAPIFSGSVFFRNYGNIEGIKQIGVNFLDSKRFKEISFFIKSIKDVNLNPVSFFAGDNGDYEIYLGDNSKNYNFYGGKIIFNKDDNLGEVFDNLTAILNEKILIKGFGDNVQLDYIDLRFGRKVFYKLKTSE